MKDTLIIRIVSRDKERLDVSFEHIGAVEIYNHTSLTVLNPIKQDWWDWVNFVIHNKNRNSPSQKDIRKTLLKKSRAFESVLFGGKQWLKKGVSKYIFVTDPEWNLLPFEILPTEDESLLGEKYIVLRNIRSPAPIPNKKKGNGGILWIQTHQELKDSLAIEKDSLESIFSNQQINWDTVVGRENILNRIWTSLNSCEYVHFAGHSEKEGIYISENKILTPTEWEGQDLSNISLAFFNTCFSGREASNDTGLAGNLLRIGVRELVGFSHLLPTEKAIQFAIEFWKLFLKLGDSEKSVLRTRQILSSIYGKNDITHLLFVHYSGTKELKIDSKINWKYLSLFLLISTLFFSGFYFFNFHNKKTEIPTNVQQIHISEMEQKIPKSKSEEFIQQKRETPKKSESNVIQNKKVIPPKKEKNIQKVEVNSVAKNKSIEENIKESHIVNKEKISKSAKEEYDKKEVSPIRTEKKQENSELQNAIEKFRNSYHPLLDDKEKEKIIGEIMSKDEDDSVKRWILKKKTGL